MDSAVFSHTVRRYRSIELAFLRRALLLAASAPLAIAAGFAVAGVWMVAPFALGEAVVIGLVLAWLRRHSEDFERIEVIGDVLVLEARAARQSRRYEFNRHWAQVVVHGGARNGKLAFRSHGREVAFGGHLNEAERRELLRRLQTELRRR